MIMGMVDSPYVLGIFFIPTIVPNIIVYYFALRLNVY